MWMIFSCLSFLMVGALCKHLTDDFSVMRLVPAHKDISLYQEKNPNNLPQLLQQTYTYLGKGKQAYVFVSEDKKHVLKLFKPFFPSYSITILGHSFNCRFSKIPFIQTIYSFFYPEEGRRRREQDFRSYINAFTILKEDTVLEYLHLSETNNLHNSLQIVDKIGVSHTIDSNTSCFLIQRKIDLLYPTLADCLQKNDIEKAKKLIESFARLSLKLAQLKIVNPTTIEENWGCLEDQSLLLDVGRLLTAQDLHKNPPSLDQAYHTIHHLKKWLSKHSPSLCQYLEESLSVQRAHFHET